MARLLKSGNMVRTLSSKSLSSRSLGKSKPSKTKREQDIDESPLLKPSMIVRAMSSESLGKSKTSTRTPANPEDRKDISKPSTPAEPSKEDGKELVFNDEAALNAAYKDLKSSLKRRGSIGMSHIVEVLHNKKEVHDLIEEHFPGAMTGADILAKVVPMFEKYGLTPENTLFAESICPDEINHEDGDTPDLFAKHLGEGFHMGGLAGIPFTGKTGFAAFSHHVPEKGHAFILMAPHIGLSETNKLGKYSRIGQSEEGGACGAVVGALNHCICNKPLPDFLEAGDDVQMCYIIHRIHENKERILAEKKKSENAMQAMAARVAHDVGRAMLDRICTMDFGHDNTQKMILTGIQINMPKPFDGFFQPISFQIRNKKGEVKDLFEETFGDDVRQESNTRTPIVVEVEDKMKNLKVSYVYVGGIIET